MQPIDALVDTDWLENELGASDLVVLDCTVELSVGEHGYVSKSGSAQFESAHIPGARFADLEGELSDPDSTLRYALPTARIFAAAAERLGVSDGARVVLYDNDGSMWAARVWWMLRWVGFDNAALLDGGFGAWNAEGRRVETGPSTGPSPRPNAQSPTLTVNERPTLIADQAEVLAAIGDGATCLINALAPSIHRGEVQRYVRAGHIPTSLNIASSALIDPSTGRFRPLEEVRSMFPERAEARVVTY